MNTVAVCGAGTMGSGIAQVSAQAGFYTLLFDLDNTALERAEQRIRNSLLQLVDKKKLSAAESQQINDRIRYIKDVNDCLADLIIEAIVEKAEAKVNLFNQLAEVNHGDVIFATNTSSLSVTKLQSLINEPSRVAGLHFFNPAPLMKLVEVVRGEHTREEVVKQLFDFCTKLNKTAVICQDSPGFIVNRVARHYYLEAMNLVEQGVAGFEQVDQLMEASGFKMGPFKLMDLIGMDINLAVSESIYAAFGNAERFKPSELQKAKVAAGELGKKTGKGWYEQ